MNKIIASMAGTIASAALALIPMPLKQWAGLRTAGAGACVGFSIAGYCVSERKKQQQLAFDRWQFEQQQQQKLIEEATRPVVIETAVNKLKTQAKYALADHKDDVSAAYTAVMIDKYGEDWIRSQLPQPEPEPEQIALPEPELAAIVEEIKQKDESFAAKKAKLLKFINEHELGWIAQCMKKPVVIYGDQGSGKSYFAEFLALCRYYLRGHQIISIADPHFHQNCDYCWQHLVKLGVKGFGAHHNYQEVNSQILAMYDRFTKRTLKDTPITSIFDEVTRYGQEEATQESAAKLGSKLSSDPRKANESPILVSHAKTLAALGGSDGFADAIRGNFIIIKLNSNSEQEPLWRGTISGIKDEDGEPIENLKISIAPEWIRSSWVYDLFNSASETLPETVSNTANTETETDSTKLDRILGISEDYWRAESNPEMLDRLKKEWIAELGNSPDNQPDNAQDKPDNLDGELSVASDFISLEITPEPLPREIYPLIWDAGDFARLLPNDSESAIFERILELSDKYKSASKIIQQGLGFTQGKGKPKSYSDVGKPCFKYIVMKYGTPSLIANFKEYLERK
ncbi:ATP-binding protein [Microcoleus sp. T3B2]|uniref:ATP-binding protein n=1 Tax=Microcoleus sp. T3B2 TaxID=3055426 RepID=UPI002FD44A7B